LSVVAHVEVEADSGISQEEGRDVAEDTADSVNLSHDVPLGPAQARQGGEQT
jgi:hypothetical protein